STQHLLLELEITYTATAISCIARTAPSLSAVCLQLQPLFLLSVSDLLLALCWLIGAAVYSTHCNSLNTHCYNLHTVEQSPTDAACQANFSQPYRCLLMDTGALYLTSEHQQPIRACRALHTYGISVFLATFIVFVVKARRIYRRVVTSNGYLGNQQRTSFRVMDRRMLLYPLVFVLCWGPAVGLAFLRVVKPSLCQGKAGVVLYISQALTSASQGFLNCLVYGWTHARLRQAGRTVLSRDVDTQTPLLRSQKRSYQTLPNIS
uniref:Transmembrane protein 116 n=1 Tax=Lates calcarifer TaxID=8187 RepID=A0A4W6DQU4_LATCA